RGELVERDAGGGGEVTDLLRAAAADLDEPRLGRAHAHTGAPDELRELAHAGGADTHGRALRGVDDVLDGPGGDDPPATDDEELVRGLRHLAHEVGGEEDRAAVVGEVADHRADPLDPLGVEAVD